MTDHNAPAPLAGHDLPPRWRGRERFVMLATGFGAGDDFLATWQAWRADPQRCGHLVYIAIDPHPLTREALAAAHPGRAPLDLAAALRRAWPPLTPNLHRLAFDDARVVLLLAIAEVPASLRELVAEVDAFCIAVPPTTVGAPPWDERMGRSLARLAAPGATLVASGTTPAWRGALASAGFAWHADAADPAPVGPLRARYSPRFTPRGVPARVPRSMVAGRVAHEPHALIVGGGLAGCAAAWALATHGWRITLIERHAQIASEASGNPAGLFHGIVHARDGVHARFNRAAALAAQGAVQVALERGVPGAVRGLLRLENTLDAAHMQALADRLRLPPDYVRALSAHEASAQAGIVLDRACWFYPGGGWVRPGGLARVFLERAGTRAALRAGSEVASVAHTSSGWRAFDAQGRTIAEAPVVVLANAGEAFRLLGSPAWPIDSIRGQISIAPAAALRLPQLPIAGSGYLLPAIGADALFGATAQPGDADGTVRNADHATNLAQLARLLGHAVDLPLATLTGRTAWRCSAADRLPVIGAVPDPAAMGARRDQPRLVPRVPGLFVFSALGSRGIGWSALGAQVLASWVTGAPAPVEAGLLDAIDPARFVSRDVRRASRG